MKSIITIPMRVGIGVDFHRFALGRKLILGGVEIPYEKGLTGHSDADVLTHAICDALLGAAALGDIGTHFPDTDSQYTGISSLTLLDSVYHKLKEKGFLPHNVDSVVIAEAPKIAPYISSMILNLSRTLQISPEHICIKATTAEQMGAIGRREGIMAQAVATVIKHT